jgi:hypothetical protein
VLHGHAVMENRNGLVVQAEATPATGTAEPETAADLVERLAGEPEAEDAPPAQCRHRTVGADKGVATSDFVGALRDLHVTPHVAQKTKGSAIDGRTTVGLNMDDPVWDPSTFSKNRDRFLAGGVADTFFDRVLAQARLLRRSP